MWRGKVTYGDAYAPETVNEDPRTADDLSDVELADALRTVALYAGHEYIEEASRPDLVRAFRAEKAGRTAPADSGLGGPDFQETSASPPQQRQQAQAGNAGVEPSEMFIDKSIIGTDNRTVQNNFTDPNPAVIVLDNTLVGGSWTNIDGSECTAHVIGPRTALSAAHCFWDEGANTWEPDFMWAPGYDSADSDPSPWGQFDHCYVVYKPAGYNNNQVDLDYAVISFHPVCAGWVVDGTDAYRPGDHVGWFGMVNSGSTEAQLEALTLRVTGYPGAGQTCGASGVACNIRPWSHSTSGTSNIDATGLLLRHKIDTTEGQSGAPVYDVATNRVAGIHTYGLASSFNRSKRMD